MVEIIGKEIGTLTEIEVKSVLRRKFLRIRLGRREYCFRILQVKDVINGANCTLKMNKGFNDYENVYGFMNYEDECIPVFDLEYSNKANEMIACENYSVVIMDVLSNGFILQLGVVVKQIQNIIHAAMSEMSEDIFFGEN